MTALPRLPTTTNNEPRLPRLDASKRDGMRRFAKRAARRILLAEKDFRAFQRDPRTGRHARGRWFESNIAHIPSHCKTTTDVTLGVSRCRLYTLLGHPSATLSPPFL